ncbi:MAG: nucleoside permease [Planctomycetaceae bacterium]|nr:nucleoside permease [Planctomycetaceae bacterium]
MSTPSASLPPLERTSGSIRFRLSVMMFLQYFIQGSYLPIASLYVLDALRFSEFEVGLFGSALAVGPLFAPFIVGQLVDRHWSTQRVLAVSHVLGGITMLILYTQTAVWPFVLLGTLYSILYVPTMMLTNSLAFHHLRQRDREFPLIRLFGTIGFVVPAWCVELYFSYQGLTGSELNEARGIVLCLAGVFGLITGLYCWFLPATPPERNDDSKFAPAKVFALLRMRSLLSLVIISFFVAIVHKFYFVWNAPFLKDILRSGGITGAWEQRISSIGQISEVLIMVGLGWLITRHGFRKTLSLGIAAYTLRCLVFSTAITLTLPFGLRLGMVLFGQALHGVCFACFLAAAYMFVDRISPKDIRGSMQNIYGTFVVGLGFFAGGFISGALGDWLTTPPDAEVFRETLGLASRSGLILLENGKGLRDWTLLWALCGILGVLCLLTFWFAFPNDSSAPPATSDDGEES